MQYCCFLIYKNFRMKRFTLYIIFFGIFGFTIGQTKIIAHRGFWDVKNSAQNSITSLYKAAEAGFYGSEFDVQSTKDGVLILFHDNELNGKRITETPYDSLRNYRLKNGEIIPTLEQFLIHSRNYPSIKLILEIKTNNDISSKDIVSLVSSITKEIEKFDLQSRVEYIAFNYDVCKEVRKEIPKAVIYYLGGNISPEKLKEDQISGLDYHYNVFKENPAFIEQAHKAGLKVNVWTVNDPLLMQQMIKAGVDFITTDKPLQLKEILMK